MRHMRHAVEKDWNHVRCYDGDVKLGDLEWAERPGRTFEMHLDVDPVHHRQGIGRAMLNELLRHLENTNQKPMSVYSFSAGDNRLAHAYFTGCGFGATYLTDFYGTGRHGWFYWMPVGTPE